MREPARESGTDSGTKQGLYPIRTVSRLTGVNAVTLRAWERRYGLIKPHRTESGHRVYSDNHINEIRQILEMIDRGMSIGQVGTLLKAESAKPLSQQDEDGWDIYRRRMIGAVQSFDEQLVDETYNDAMSIYPVDVVTKRLVVPVLGELGQRWHDRSGTVSEEHFFTSLLRNKLGARLHHRGKRSDGPRLILACLQGERHEIGALLFALSAMDRVFRLIYLGANVPLRDLPGVQTKAQCCGIILAGTNEPSDYDLSAELSELVERVDIPVFVGGRVCSHARRAIEGSGAISLGTELSPAMRVIESELNAAQHRSDSPGL